MEFSKKSIDSTPEILKRKLGGELFVPVTIDASALAGGVCKAGTPIGADGKVANTASVKGILLNDVYAENPNGSLIVAFATINETVAEAWSGVTYADAVKTALKNVVFD